MYFLTIAIFDQFILVLFLFLFSFWRIPLKVTVPVPKQVLKKPVVIYFGCLRLLLIYTNHQLHLLMISVISQASVIVIFVAKPQSAAAGLTFTL
ncbi:hypothetical protein DXX93_13160 [Thalassotalea euphylliae]|uniref:Uncharacterized protein n=1 Tax=Thalassotalea euphylliae TaxID=1655234 RepID=A0A3E0TSP2_9GAMM|nr:hypothetical protein DXX93_13160 [Thalassotalea euphylliae]